MKVETTIFTDKGYKRKRGVTNDSKISGLSNWKNGLTPLTKTGKAVRGVGVGKHEELIFPLANFKMPITRVRGGGGEVIHSSPRMLAHMLPLQTPPPPTYQPSSLSITPGDPGLNTAKTVQTPSLDV